MEIRLRAAQKSHPFPASPIKKRSKRDQAIREIKKYQRSTDLLIPRASFARLVREVLQEIPDLKHISHFEKRAMEALQEAAEMHLVHVMEDTNLLTIHRHRQTIAPPDMQLAQHLRHRHGVA